MVAVWQLRIVGTMSLIVLTFIAAAAAMMVIVNAAVFDFSPAASVIRPTGPREHSADGYYYQIVTDYIFGINSPSLKTYSRVELTMVSCIRLQFVNKAYMSMEFNVLQIIRKKNST